MRSRLGTSRKTVGCIAWAPVVAAVAALLVSATGATAQFPSGTGEFFITGNNVDTPFSGVNWSLDGGCTPGLVNDDFGARGIGGAPLIMRGGGTGTRMIMDLNPGAGSSTIGGMLWTGNDVITRLFFSADATTGAGMELYRAWQVLYPTTLLEADINLGANGSSPADFFRLPSSSGHMLFSADDGANGRELWKAQAGSNFFTMQTVLIKDINIGAGSSDPAGFANTGNTTVFAVTGHEVRNPGQIDEEIIFIGRELWKTDGAIGGAGTTLLIDINQTPDSSASSNPEQLTQDGGGATAKVYFTADNGVNGRELWRTDGTLGGTNMLKDIIAGPTGSNPTNLTVGGGTLALTLFFTVDSDGANGMELWTSLGSLDGSDTLMLKDVGGSPSDFKSVGSLNLVFFIKGNELWKSDGTNGGTVMVQSFNSIAGPMATTGGFVYFAADDGGGAGTELWRSDGTTTSMVANINPGAGSSSPTNLFSLNNTIYFSADDGSNGRELWRTDTGAGAVMVMDINPGAPGSDPANFNEFNAGTYGTDTFAFTADDGTHGRELWQSDGNEEPAILGVSHKWDLGAVVTGLDAGSNAVAGTDANVLVMGCGLIDGPTLGGGNNRHEARQAIHQMNVMIELTDGTDRAPVVITDVDCGDGSGFTRPRASLTGDGQPHNVIAAGMFAIMDQDPCDTSAMGPESPRMPLMEVPMIYDGLNWIPMNLENFPDMLQVSGINTTNQLTLTTLPVGLEQATIDPYGTKRFDNLKIFVYSDSFQVLYHKRQGGNDVAPGDTNWVVTVPRQYTGAFRALHIGTPSCTPNPYANYADTILMTGGVFTDSLVPFGACCSAADGCTEVDEPADCTDGVFAPWKSCDGIICCPSPWANADRDSDVDSDDFGAFQACVTGAGGGVPAGCECFNNVVDDAIDNLDFDEFVKCSTGPEIPFDVNNPPAGCTPCAAPPAICP